MGRPARVSREDVLRAAREAFGEHGFAGTTLADIGARIRVSPAALLRHGPHRRQWGDASATFATWGNSGIVPYEGAGNQLSKSA